MKTKNFLTLIVSVATLVTVTLAGCGREVDGGKKDFEGSWHVRDSGSIEDFVAGETTSYQVVTIKGDGAVSIETGSTVRNTVTQERLGTLRVSGKNKADIVMSKSDYNGLLKSDAMNRASLDYALENPMQLERKDKTLMVFRAKIVEITNGVKTIEDRAVALDKISDAKIKALRVKANTK